MTKKFAYGSETGIKQIPESPATVWAPETDPPDYPRALCVGASLKADFLICCPPNMSRRDVLTHCQSKRWVDIKAGAFPKGKCEYGTHWMIVR